MAVLPGLSPRGTDSEHLSNNEHRESAEDLSELRISELLHRERPNSAIRELQLPRLVQPLLLVRGPGLPLPRGADAQLIM